MLNACSLHILYFSLRNYENKIHIKYDLFHHDDEILPNVGAGLNGIYAVCTAVTSK